MPTYWQTTKYRRATIAEIRLQQHLFRLAQSLRSMSLGSLAAGLVIGDEAADKEERKGRAAKDYREPMGPQPPFNKGGRGGFEI